MALSVGARLGPYETIALIGVGGMGEVYEAIDPRLRSLKGDPRFGDRVGIPPGAQK